MKSIEELKADFDKKEKELREKKKKLIEQAQARKNKAEALEKTRLRKADAHIKIILGGAVLADMKKTKNTALIDEVLKTLKTKRDKELFINLKKTILG
jgi:hypothetical protein